MLNDVLAKAIDEADDKWQHGIGSGGYDVSGPVLGIPVVALADALTPVVRTLLKEVWEDGFSACAHMAMCGSHCRCSEETKRGLNPYDED